MTELVAGVTIGFAAGISPGPLQALVVTSSLERGFGAGWRVAVAPLFTDVPVVAIAVGVASTVPARALNGLAVAGGALVVAFGLRLLATSRSGEPQAAGASDVWRGMAVNLLSPHPWVFWLAVGGPLVVAGWRNAPWRAVAFLLGFYALLVGSKVVLALAVGRTRERLTPPWRQRLVVVGALLLVAAGAVLAWQGAAGSIA